MEWIQLVRDAQKHLRNAIQTIGAVSYDDPGAARPHAHELRHQLHSLETAAKPLLAAIEAVNKEIAAEELRKAQAHAQDDAIYWRQRAAIAEPAAALEWLAGKLLRDAATQRFTLIDRTAPHDTVAREAGAIAEITPGLLVGGEFGMSLLKDWPITRSGGRTALGGPGLAKLIGGPAAVPALRRRIAELELYWSEQSWRTDVLEVAATIAQGSEDATRRFYAKWGEAQASDAALRTLLEEVSRATGRSDVAMLDDRMRLLRPLRNAFSYQEEKDIKRLAAGPVNGLISKLEELARENLRPTIDGIVSQLRAAERDGICSAHIAT